MSSAKAFVGRLPGNLCQSVVPNSYVAVNDPATGSTVAVLALAPGYIWVAHGKSHGLSETDLEKIASTVSPWDHSGIIDGHRWESVNGDRALRLMRQLD